MTSGLRVYMIQKMYYMAKKVITGHLPPPVVVLVHADHDVHRRSSVLETVR